MILLKICRACLKQGHGCEIMRIAFKKFWNDKAQNVLSRKHVSHFRPLLGVTVSKNSPVSIIIIFACSHFVYACTLPMAELPTHNSCCFCNRFQQVAHCKYICICMMPVTF